jgi:hypothetical protein
MYSTTMYDIHVACGTPVLTFTVELSMSKMGTTLALMVLHYWYLLPGGAYYIMCDVSCSKQRILFSTTGVLVLIIYCSKALLVDTPNYKYSVPKKLRTGPCMM